ncbi:MAG: tetratricopeptide repeat protein [Candidatus Aureabacteria bacterium]|nr:tetratricopeptide repeat protein [Candidatus Auribacterota bacterium]
MKKTFFMLLSIALFFCCSSLAKGQNATKVFLSEKEYLDLPEEKIDIAEGALIIAKGFYPELDIQKYLDQIDVMAKELKLKLQGITDPSEIIEIISKYLFIKNKLEYKKIVDKKDIFFLNNVFDNKSGNCVSFSYLYLSVAERLQLPFYGVSAPEHMFVRFEDKNTKINIECTDNGTLITEKEIIERLNIHPIAIENGAFLKTLNKKQVLSAVLNSRGNAYKANGNFDAAILDLEKAIEINPKFAEAYNNRGIAYYNKGNTDEAISSFNKSIEIDPRNVDAYSNRGIAYDGKGKPDEAISDFNKSIEIDPEFANAYYGRGVAYDNKGKSDEAISDYDKAIEIDPEFAKAYYSRGNIYRSKSDLDEAILDYNKAIEIDPKYAYAYYGRGKAYYAKGKSDEAISDYDKVIEIDSSDTDVYYDRGKAYYEKDKPAQAISDFSKAIEIDSGDAYAYFYRGKAYYDTGKLDQAILDYNKTIEIKPDYAKAYNDRGRIYFDKNKPAQAYSDYNKAIELKPEYADAYYNKACLCDMAGRTKEAIEAYKGYVQHVIPNPKNKLYIKAIQDRIKQLENKQ